MSKVEVDKLVDTVTALLENGQWKDAIVALTNQIGLVEKHWELSWNLGWALYKIDDLEESIKHLSLSVTLNPTDPLTHWALGTVYSEKKNYVNAEKEFLAALSLRDGYAPRVGLALVYLDQGLVEKAENVHLEGIRLAPSSRKRAEAYADFLWDVGRQEEAKQQYAKAKQLPPNT